jgi:outer membrane protein OmpA-like peptidoglycan-associated protein
MRNFIIGLSILFFTLSGLIALKALDMPVDNARFENAPIEQKSVAISPEVKETLEQFTKEQAANRALVEKLQATIDTLEDKLEDNIETSPALEDKQANKIEKPPVNVDAEAPEAERTILTVLGTGVFGNGKVVIEEALMNAVNEIIPDIQAYPDHRIVIEGHTSNVRVMSSAGEYIDNMELSFFRAKAVASMLEKRGISRERISVAGYGDTRPEASNDTYEGRVKNRRVEVKLVAGNKSEYLSGQSIAEQKAGQALVGRPSNIKEARILAVLGTGLFGTGKVVIEEALMNAVDEIIPDIQAYPDHRIVIEGHTSNVRIMSSAGEYIDNMELSFIRAKAVASMLEKRGISSERISVAGYGDTRPAASNDTYKGRVKNRRVEVKLVPVDRKL